MSHAVLQVGDRAEGHTRRRSRPLCRPRAARAYQPGRCGGERGGLRAGSPVGAGAERRSRSEPPPSVSERDPRLLPQSRLRLQRSGGLERERSNHAWQRERRDGRRGGVALRHPDPRVPPPRRHPGRGQPGAHAPREAQNLHPHPPARPRSGLPGDRRALDRESMGQSAEKMAKENHITRAAQDAWALRSHQRAAAGTDDGRVTAEIVPWFPARSQEPVITQDNGIRRDTSLEQMAKLKPVFDRRYGTVTAANSSPLTDGASAVLLMSDAAARALGYTPLAYVRSYAVAAVDPGWQLLQAPIFAVPKALERARIQWKDLGLIEVHEAFAAQVLSNLQGWRALGWDINEDIINVMGGSIAIGHPFGATGARLVTTLANEMARRDVPFGLLSICAQGGMGFALVLERR